jgi:hypothetical protein
MKWPLMSDEELHAFGIDVILPDLVKEGVTVEEVNRDLGRNPQIVGKRWFFSLLYLYEQPCIQLKGYLLRNNSWSV